MRQSPRWEAEGRFPLHSAQGLGRAGSAVGKAINQWHLATGLLQATLWPLKAFHLPSLVSRTGLHTKEQTETYNFFFIL